LDHRPLFWQELEYILNIKNEKEVFNPKSELFKLYEEIIKIESNLLDRKKQFNFDIKNVLDKLHQYKKKKVYILFVSATPAEYEIKASNNTIVEQIIRPT